MNREVVEVESRQDIAQVDDIADPAVDAAVQLLDSGELCEIVHVPEWLAEQHPVIDPVAGDTLFDVELWEYSDDAWKIADEDTAGTDRDVFLPKSQVTVLRRGSDSIESEQAGLSAFAGGDGR